MKPTDRMKQRLQAEFGLTVSDIRRTRSGRNQKADGHLSWFAECVGSSSTVGSQYPIIELLKHAEWDLYRPENGQDISILLKE